MRRLRLGWITAVLAAAAGATALVAWGWVWVEYLGLPDLRVDPLSPADLAERPVAAALYTSRVALPAAAGAIVVPVAQAWSCEPDPGGVDALRCRAQGRVDLQVRVARSRAPRPEFRNDCDFPVQAIRGANPWTPRGIRLLMWRRNVISGDLDNRRQLYETQDYEVLLRIAPVPGVADLRRDYKICSRREDRVIFVRGGRALADTGYLGLFLRLNGFAPPAAPERAR